MSDVSTLLYVQDWHICHASALLFHRNLRFLLFIWDFWLSDHTDQVHSALCLWNDHSSDSSCLSPHLCGPCMNISSHTHCISLQLPCKFLLNFSFHYLLCHVCYASICCPIIICIFCHYIHLSFQFLFHILTVHRLRFLTTRYILSTIKNKNF